MKAIPLRLPLLAMTLALVCVATGCATSRDHKLKCKPVTDYPQTELLDLNVALVLQREFAGGVVFERPPVMMSPGMRFYVPDALEASAEAMARALFQRVQRVKTSMADNSATFDAFVRPHIIAVEEAYDFKGGVHLLLEWTVTRPNGELVWKKTVRGEGTGSMGIKTLFQRALADAFQRSFEQMSRAPEIKALGSQRAARDSSQ